MSSTQILSVMSRPTHEKVKFTLIPRDYYPVQAIKHEDARFRLPAAQSLRTDNKTQVDQLVIDITEKKKEIKEQVCRLLKRGMIGMAQRLDLKFDDGKGNFLPVDCLRDIRSAWVYSKDPAAIAETMYEVVQGFYETVPDYIYNTERDVLFHFKLAYDDSYSYARETMLSEDEFQRDKNIHSKGCVRKIMSSVMSELRKQANGNSSMTHNMCIAIKRPPGQKDNRRRKRSFDERLLRPRGGTTEKRVRVRQSSPTKRWKSTVIETFSPSAEQCSDARKIAAEAGKRMERELSKKTANGGSAKATKSQNPKKKNDNSKRKKKEAYKGPEDETWEDQAGKCEYEQMRWRKIICNLARLYFVDPGRPEYKKAWIIAGQPNRMDDCEIWRDSIGEGDSEDDQQSNSETETDDCVGTKKSVDDEKSDDDSSVVKKVAVLPSRTNMDDDCNTDEESDDDSGIGYIMDANTKLCNEDERKPAAAASTMIVPDDGDDGSSAGGGDDDGDISELSEEVPDKEVSDKLIGLENIEISDGVIWGELLWKKEKNPEWYNLVVAAGDECSTDLHDLLVKKPEWIQQITKFYEKDPGKFLSLSAVQRFALCLSDTMGRKDSVKKKGGKVKKPVICKPCKHDDFLLELSYKEETCSAYWSTGMEMFGTVCGICDITISTESKRDDCWVPSVQRPVYCCVNRTSSIEKCKFVVCGKCFGKGLETSVRPRRKRA